MSCQLITSWDVNDFEEGGRQAVEGKLQESCQSY